MEFSMCPATNGESRQAALELLRARQNSGKADSHAKSLEQIVADAVASNPATIRDENTAKIRVRIAAQNELVCETLRRALGKVGNIEVAGASSDGVSWPAGTGRHSTDVLVLISREGLQADLEQIAAARKHGPAMRILLMGTARDDSDFLQYVRAGINGFLWREASAEDVARAIQNVYDGKAVCPGELCAALFRFFEDAEPRMPFGSPTQRLGLTRREQQIVPLIAKGFTNKEIANHFCLSEQTVKNHLYRMKHKIGAEDRLSIVQKFRHHGLLL
jgi:DNA-binding NarL/FixJ family response regulator